MEKDNTKQLQIIAKMLNPDRFITADDISAIRDAVFTLLSNFKKGNEELNAETKQEVEDLLKVISIKQKELYEDIKDGKKEMIALHKEQIEEIEYLAQEIKAMEPKPGEKGKDADEEKIVARIYAMIESNKNQTEKESIQNEISGEEMIDKINDLDYTNENLIDIKRIRGWETFFNNKKSSNAKSFQPTVLTNAMDLDTSARANGYAIVWDAATGMHKYAASAGGGSMEIGGAITSATAKSILYAGAGGVLAETNSDFVYDYTNNRFGLGTDTPLFKLHAIGSTAGGFAKFERTTSGTNSIAGVIILESTSSGTMADGFGVQLSFSLKDTDAVSNQVAVIAGVRQGADNSGYLGFYTTNAGSNTLKMAIDKDGYVGIGTSTPVSRLQITGNTAINGTLGNRGHAISVDTITTNDAVSSGTVALFSSVTFFPPTVTATSATTYTNAQTLYVGGVPTASTNVTFTNVWAFRVGSGASGFGGGIYPTTAATYDIGNSSLTWGNIYMGSGKKIDFAGDVTITHTTDTLSFAGAATVYTFDTGVAIGTATQSSGKYLTIDHGTMTNNQGGGISLAGNIGSNVGSNGILFNLNNSISNANGYLRLDRTASSAFIGMSLSVTSRDGFRIMTGSTTPVEVARFASTFVKSSGTDTALMITPNINQTSTAGYIAFQVNVTETGTGSGSKLLANFQVGGVTQLSITNAGAITALNATLRSTSGSAYVEGSSSSVYLRPSGQNQNNALRIYAGSNGTKLDLYSSAAANSGVENIYYNGVGILQSDADFRLTTAGTNTASIVTVGGTQTLTGKKATLAAGTATAGTAPLKFTSGVNLTTAEAGAMEYDGTWAYFTLTGTTRRTFVFADTIQTITNKRNQPRVYTATNNASLTPEIDTYDVFHLTAMSANTTINNKSTSTPVDGEQMRFRFLDNGTSRTLTWGTDYVAKAGTALPTATTIGKNLIVLFEWNANLSKWNCLASGLEA